MALVHVRVRALGFASSVLLIGGVARGEDATTKGTIDVQTSDGRGTILVDAVKVAEGAFHGELDAGVHELVVERPGFGRFDKRVTIEAGKVASFTITLTREEASPVVAPPAPVFGGVYGGFLLGPSLEPAGMGNTFEQTCPLTGAVSCLASAPAGLTIAGYAGYTWDPIGLELFGAFGFDYTSPSSTFDGVVQPGSNAALTGPARTEQFQIARIGGMGAIRARATIDGKKIRASFALGPGVAVRGMLMARTATTTVTGGAPSATDTFVPQPISYASAALSLEATVAYRLSATTAFTVGLSMWLENAGQDAVTDADPHHYFVTLAVPLRTPSYRLASGTQFFLWPFIGMQFGP